MNICIAADNNYASILQVVIISTLENNHCDIVFHIFESDITNENKKKIELLVKKYNQKIYFYNVDNYINKVKNRINNSWANKNSYVAYARLFMPEMLPESVERFLYFDCDVLINGNIKELYDLDLSNNVIAGVKDVLPYFFKKSMNLEDGKYFNSGVLLFNSKLWKKEGITSKIIDYCLNHEKDLFPDQDALNLVLKNRIKELPPKYCVFYPEADFSVKLQLKGFGGSEKQYYSKKLLMEMKQNPTIIHYTDSVLGRPWQNNNINNHSKEWLYYYDLLPNECKMKFINKNISWKTKIYRLLYKILPLNCFAYIYYYKRNKNLKERMKVL